MTVESRLVLTALEPLHCTNSSALNRQPRNTWLHSCQLTPKLTRPELHVRRSKQYRPLRRSVLLPWCLKQTGCGQGCRKWRVLHCTLWDADESRQSEQRGSVITLPSAALGPALSLHVNHCTHRKHEEPCWETSSVCLIAVVKLSQLCS